MEKQFPFDYKNRIHRSVLKIKKCRSFRWKMKQLSFADLGSIADQVGVVLCINVFLDGENRFITYHKGRVEAATIV